ncbi:hypothetical protein [Hydrogenimonas sp.]
MQPIVVTFEEITLHPAPHPEHDFLLDSKEVAKGYGATLSVITKTKTRHADELVEGKHWLRLDVETAGGRQKIIHWTKRGIVRLGFFIRSERAKRFRDWAEDLIVAHRPILPAQCKEEIITPQIMGYKGNLAKQKKKIEELHWENAGLRNKIQEMEKKLGRQKNTHIPLDNERIVKLIDKGLRYDELKARYIELEKIIGMLRVNEEYVEHTVKLLANTYKRLREAEERQTTPQIT